MFVESTTHLPIKVFMFLFRLPKKVFTSHFAHSKLVIFSLSLALSTYLSFLCTVRVMDYFLAELIAKMGERLLAMQAPCGDQPRGWQA